jgi:hypothetical protein
VSIVIVFQAEAPPDGSVLVRTLPSKSVATHRDTEGQEIPKSICSAGSLGAGSICARCQEDAPAAGSVELRIDPLPSVATHSDTDGQLIAFIDSAPCSVEPTQVTAPRAGEVDVINRSPPTATQRLADGQATPVKDCQ